MLINFLSSEIAANEPNIDLTRYSNCTPRIRQLDSVSASLSSALKKYKHFESNYASVLCIPRFVSLSIARMISDAYITFLHTRDFEYKNQMNLLMSLLQKHL